MADGFSSPHRPLRQEVAVAVVAVAVAALAVAAGPNSVSHHEGYS